MTKERREELLRAGRTDDGEEFHWSADVDPLDFETRSIKELNWGELRQLLSLERACSTCRYMFISAGLVDVDEQVPTCTHPDSPVRDYGDLSIDEFGCSLWEKADPKERA